MIKKALDPLLIPKYTEQLLIPPAYKPLIVRNPVTGQEISHNYTVYMNQFKQRILPQGFPKTTVWGFEGKVENPFTGRSCYYQSSPGPTFKAVRGIPIHVKWVNNITGCNQFAVDPTLHWANPNNMVSPKPPFSSYPPGYLSAQGPVPLVVHLHGGEVRSDSDGSPEAWFTAGERKTGKEFTKSCYTYPNAQESATLWYHDHALGTTRLDVYAGLAGFYLIADPCNKIEALLPTGKYDIPLVIQDRSFYEDGSLAFPSDGINPQLHPYWRPGFSGDTIMVNGKVWPNLNVERRQYRFRILNGSNSRIYNLKLSSKQSFTQIASDGGFLSKPVLLKELLIAPGERAEILIDFSLFLPGSSIIMENDAKAPYPDGTAPDPDTVGQIMRFAVADTNVTLPEKLPLRLNCIPKLFPDVPNKVLTLNSASDSTGLAELLLDGQMWDAPISELPVVGTTDEWEIVNMTNGAHPIHVHLIQFQIENRQDFDFEAYSEEWTKLNGQPPLHHPTIVLPVEPYLQGDTIEPALNERGWKDTVLVMPNQVTRLKLRFAPQDADPEKVKPCVNLFPFDPSYGPGYVWHCHILDHEDNEMMRPYKVLPFFGYTDEPSSHEM